MPEGHSRCHVPVVGPEKHLSLWCISALEELLTSEEVHAAGEQGPGQETAKRPRHAEPAGPAKLVLDAQKHVVEDQRGALHVDVNGIPHRASNAWETCRTGGRCHTELPHRLQWSQRDHKYKILSYSLLSSGADFRMRRTSLNMRFWPLLCLSPVILADLPLPLLMSAWALSDSVYT